jgi:hypothetical protein
MDFYFIHFSLTFVISQNLKFWNGHEFWLPSTSSVEPPILNQDPIRNLYHNFDQDGTDLGKFIMWLK